MKQYFRTAGTSTKGYLFNSVASYKNYEERLYELKRQTPKQYANDFEKLSNRLYKDEPAHELCSPESLAYMDKVELEKDNEMLDIIINILLDLDFSHEEMINQIKNVIDGRNYEMVNRWIFQDNEDD